MSEEKLPKGWKIVSLGKALSLEYGKSLPKKDRTGSGYPVMGSNGVIDEHFEYLIEGPGIIVGRKGSHGEVVWVNENFYPIDTTYFVIPRPIVDLRFAYYFLKKSDLKSLNRSTAIPGLNRTDAYNLEVPLPPLPEQQRIVAKLNAVFGHLDRVKEKLDQIPELLKNFRQQVLTQAVTGELTREWREGKGLGEWEYEKAENCCFKVQSGGTPKSDGFAETGIPFLKVYNIVNNQIDFDYKPQFVTLKAHTTTIKKSILLPGDVLMNIVGPPLNKIAIVPNDYEEWNLNQAITLFRPKDYLINKFLYYFFCEGSSVRSVHNETRGVVGQVNISLSQCRNFEIPIPSLEEQQEIVLRVDALFGLAYKIESQYQSLKAKIDQLPQSILAKAFRGELVGQEVKEYVREIGELGMVAEGEVKTF